jgi:hypothetical protein
MGGGLLQLVAYGAQDVYLTGNPQITFFKVVYRRHTNFAVESILQTFNGNASFNNTINCTISRNGDLINRVYVEFDVAGLGWTGSSTTNVAWHNYLGLRLLKNVTLEIGGQQVDKHYSEWMYIWNELSLPIGKKAGYEKMVGAEGKELSEVSTSNKTKLYVPLEFWFCRNIGLALPLIALQYHEVKLKIEFASAVECVSNLDTNGNWDSSSVSTTNVVFPTCQVWVDYIYLDTDERRKFAQLSHEYLIEQLQFSGAEEYKSQLRLNFNHPVKELVWVYNDAANWKWNNFSDSDANPFTTAHLKLNGNDRFAKREGKYFDVVQPYQHHSNVPSGRGINVYSFAIKPEEHQPSGTLNMSRIDSAILATTATLTSVHQMSVFAVNYNVLRIMSGMGGLAYSN